MYKVFSVIFFLIIHICTFSQSKIFDYLNSGLSITDCNVFDPPVNIDAVSHSSWAGGVTFNTTLGLGLQTQQKNAPFKSTAFIINYSFISGVNYEIKITARGNSNILLKASAVPNVTNFVTASQTACINDANAYNYSTAGYGQYSTQVSTASTDYNIPAFTIPSGNSAQYLFIWSSGGTPSLDLDVLYISKITITPTPIVSFNLISSPASITCGSTTPVIFTVNNIGGTSGIIGYTWNLGSASNGWEYNGSAAPSTITTGATINTLSLTPVCGSSLSNVSATVVTSANNYPTNNIVLSITQRSLLINGNETICNSEDYMIPGLTCNAEVTWSISPPTGIGNIFPLTGPTTTFTKTGNGAGILTANVTSLGCQSVSLNKDITTGGTQQSGMIYLDGIPGSFPTKWGTWNVVQYGSSSTPIKVQMSRPSTWTYSTGPVTTWWQNSSDNSIYIIPTIPSFFWNTITFNVSCYDECGQYTSNITYFQNYTALNKYVVYPNPTKGDLFISSNEDVSLNSKNQQVHQLRIQKIELLNSTGKLLRNMDVLVDQHKLNIAGYPLGQYFLRIFDGSTWETKKIILQ